MTSSRRWKIRQFKRLRHKLALFGATLLLSASPVIAGVPGGNSNVNVNVTTTTQTTTEITQVANDVILETLWEIIGTAKRENKKGKTPPPKFWSIELTVSEADFASALAGVKSELYDLAVIPGRKNSYHLVQDEQTGEELTSVNQTYEEILTGQTTETSEYFEAGGAQFGVDYIGDPYNYQTWIAIGANDVNVEVEQVTTTTEFIDAITTNEYQSVAVWSIAGLQTVSPLLLDLDGDGSIEASGGEWLPHKQLHRDRMAFFDFHGDRFPVLMEWPGPNDGILCQPPETGTMNGTHLFGTSTGFQNGYESLRTKDRDGDGKIRGSELRGLSVWQDRNSDARPQTGEVTPVEDLHITELSIHHNKFVSYYIKDGKTEKMFDWWPQTFELNRVKVMPKKT
jgi:hypothetical protein